MGADEFYEAHQSSQIAEDHKKVVKAKKEIRAATATVAKRIETVSAATESRAIEIDQISASGKSDQADLKLRIDASKSAAATIAAINETKAKSALGDASILDLVKFVNSNLSGAKDECNPSESALLKLSGLIVSLHNSTGSTDLATQKAYPDHFRRIEGYASSLEFCFTELLNLRTKDSLETDERDEKEEYWRKMLDREIDVISSS